MNPRVVAALALVFSGLTALVYQILWTRLLGFVFGTTSHSIGTVLAVFFGGMALGNALAARRVARVRNPLRLYALLELGIGLFALLSLPLLTRLDVLYAWFGSVEGSGLVALRVAACAVVLLPPTVAMGATLPVMARGVVGDDATLGRWSGILYAANTLGAVAGAYLAGFWLIPGLGLTHTLLAAASVNLAVAAAVLAVAERARRRDEGDLERALAAGRPDDPQPGRAVFLVFFGVSGFVAIGYEVVWSKLFSIVMEGTLYGFAAVLSAYLFGIGIGSLAIAPVVDRIRDLPRAFALLHVAIAAAVAAGMAMVPWLPYANVQLARWWGGGDATHLLYAVVAPVVIAPAALFGAAFPVLIRIYTRRAGRAGQGIGVAVAVNTAGSIAASLLVGFWAIESLGMDATLFGLIVLDLAVALLVLLGFQSSQGLERLAATGAAALVLGLVVFSFNGVGVDRTAAARQVTFTGLADYRSGLAEATARQLAVLEGRNAVVTVSETRRGRSLRTNGLPEAGTLLAPPYRPPTTMLLGALPYLVAERPERALVIGLGGGNTVHALLQTDVREIQVVELEEAVVQAVGLLHQGRRSPLEDPRVALRVNDGRNELLLARHRGDAGFDLIASQPSHPWLMGAANLFTEEFFALARGALREGGVFAAWVNGFRTDVESVLALATSFERVFPGSVLVDASAARDRSALLLLGMRGAVRLDLPRMAERLAAPGLQDLLGHHDLAELEALLARFEGHGADLARIDPAASNTDDNAYVETRIPRATEWKTVDYPRIDARLGPTAPLLPPWTGRLDAAALARRLAEGAATPGSRWPPAKLERWLRQAGPAVDPATVETLRAALALARGPDASGARARLEALAAAHPTRPEPLRVLARHHLERRHDPAAAARGFEAAHARSGAQQDAFDAIAALERLDPARALARARSLPPQQRAELPVWPVLAARAALAGEPADREALDAHAEALLRYRATPEGRTHPGLSALLAELAGARGEAFAERRWRDADHRERERLAAPQLAALRGALAEGRLPAARSAWRRARVLVPGHPELLDLAVALEARAGEPAALERALRERRASAPDLAEAITWENRFRRDAGLPLLPEGSVRELAIP